MVINICVDQKKTCVYVCVLNRVQLFSTSWTVALQAPLSMGFSRQEYWGGLTFPSPGDCPNSGIEPRSPTFQVDSLPSETSRKPLIIETSQKFYWLSYGLKYTPFIS